MQLYNFWIQVGLFYWTVSSLIASLPHRKNKKNTPFIVKRH